MTPPYLGVLNKIRETREMRALSDLETSNRARDESLNAAQQLQAQLEERKSLQSSTEANAYNATVGAVLSLQDLEIVSAQIAAEEARVAALLQQCAAQEKVAREAAEKALLMKDHHASLLRAKKRWERVVTDESERSLSDEIGREELEFEFIPRSVSDV